MTTKHEALCAWLGLRSEDWPPNHYALLGLDFGEADIARIEQRIHERMARVRCYQICNPEQATEGMNRLAQAYVCLTDPQAKKTYDTSLRSKFTSRHSDSRETRTASVPVSTPYPRNGSAPRPATQVPADLLDTAVDAAPVTQVDWQNTLPPPPVRQGTAETVESKPSPDVPPAVADVSPQPTPPILGLVPVPEEPLTASGPLAGYKGFSPALLCMLTCRRGLGTRHGLYRRIRQTRSLHQAWERAGKYLRKAKRPLKNPAEARDLARWLGAIAKHLRGFPRFLGRPGQPGYRLAAQARLRREGEWLNLLDGEQRELLAQDWAAGQTLLSSHRQFLRQEARTMRDLHGWRQFWRAVKYDFSVEVALLAAMLLIVLAAMVLAFH